jgi:hypothetical protein
MGGVTIDELAAETARRVRAWEDENKRTAGFDDIHLAVWVVTGELGGCAYVGKIVRKTIDILTGRV